MGQCALWWLLRSQVESLEHYESHREGSARGREVHKVETRWQGGVPGEAGLGIAFSGRRHSPDASTVTEGRECRVTA